MSLSRSPESRAVLLLSETSFKNTGFYSFVAFKPADLQNHEQIVRDTCPLSLSLSLSLSLWVSLPFVSDISAARTQQR